MIKCNFSDRTKETVLQLYKSLVRPQLEYCCQILSLHYYKDIKLIERVQRRAIKLVHGLEHLQYDDRLHHLGLSHLESHVNRMAQAIRTGLYG